MDSLVEWLGFGLCHQLPERSLFGGGVQLPVCARDTGIFVGFVIGAVLIALLHRGRRPSGFPTVGGFVLIGVLFALMALDGLTSYAGLRETTNFVRLASGVAAGFAVSAVVVPMLNGELWLSASPDRVLAPTRRLAVWAALIPVTVALVWWGGPLLGVAYPLLVSVAILATLLAVNLVIVSLLPPFERRAESWRDLWVPGLVAVGLMAVELVGASLLRIGLETLAERVA